MHAGGSGVRLYDGPDLKLFILVGWGWSFLSVAWPTGVQLVFFFCSGVSKLFGAQVFLSSGSLLNLLSPRFLLKLNISLNDLAVKLRIHGRHPMLSYLSSLPIAALRSLDTEANRFYDRNHQMYDAALLTRCYTQHALRPFIDSESNHIRSFIKIPFINKGIDFIDLPSIFQDKSVIQSIPTYFQNSEPPIICYKYNKPIRNTIFNFNKLVSDLDIHANTPKS